MSIAARFKEKNRTPLLEWMEKNGASNWQLAKHLRCSPMTVEYWKWNQALPDLMYAIKIERATRGLVPVESWLNTPYGKLRYAETADWQSIGKSGSRKKHEKDLRFAEAALKYNASLEKNEEEVDDEMPPGT